MTAPQIARLKIVLAEISPPIWRRVELSLAVTMARLSEIILTAFDWKNAHLHEFEIGQRRIGTPDQDWGASANVPHLRPPADMSVEAEIVSGFIAAPPPEDEQTLTLEQVLAGHATHFLYRYDFGDDWAHEVEVEGVFAAAPDAVYPRCTAGARSAPPEDCGGVPGYADLLLVLADARDPEYAELRAWCAGFDAEQFDLAAADAALRKPTENQK
jgi:hypothetical protein